MHLKEDVVTAGTCKLITDALTEKMAAQKLLVDAEIKAVTAQLQAIRSTVYACFTTATIIITVASFLLKLWNP